MGLEGYKITEYNDVDSKLITYRDKYHEKGKFLGHEQMNEYYTMSLGNCTDWSGFPMSGKTQVLMEVLINTSKYYGWKHLVYFPDVGSNVEIIADLITKRSGKTFEPDKFNTINNMEIQKHLYWVVEHFKVLTKTEVKAKMTPMEFWDMAVELKKKEDLHTASIDSWKDLSHPYNEFGGYAQYLEYVLPYRNMIAEENDLHLHTIIHPKLTEKENGKRKPPTPYDLKGGSEWFNSGKCMITVHREDLESNQATIYFNKIKPRSNGKIGYSNIYFDKSNLSYYEMSNVNGVGIKSYATEKKENKEVKQEVRENNDFFNKRMSDNDLPF